MAIRYRNGLSYLDLVSDGFIHAAVPIPKRLEVILDMTTCEEDLKAPLKRINSGDCDCEECQAEKRRKATALVHAADAAMEELLAKEDAEKNAKEKERARRAKKKNKNRLGKEANPEPESDQSTVPLLQACLDPESKKPAPAEPRDRVPDARLGVVPM